MLMRELRFVPVWYYLTLISDYLMLISDYLMLYRGSGFELPGADRGFFSNFLAWDRQL